MAESALDRISCGLGGKTVFQHILNLTPQMLQQPDWKFRHAALMAISGLFAYYLCIFAKKKKFLVKCLFTFMYFQFQPLAKVAISRWKHICQKS